MSNIPAVLISKTCQLAQRLLRLLAFTGLLVAAATSHAASWDVVGGSFSIPEIGVPPLPLSPGNPGTFVEGNYSGAGTIVAPFAFSGAQANAYTRNSVGAGCSVRPNIGPSLADLCSWTFSWNGQESSQGGVANRVNNSDGTITLTWTSLFSSGPFSGLNGSWTLQLRLTTDGNPGSSSQHLRDDFDGDGNSDILWRNIETGGNQVWTMNGSLRRSAGSIGTVSQRNWQVAGTGDFDGNGKAEILWRNATTGGNLIWQMNGTTRVSTSSLSALRDRNWQVVGIGDFNDDGKDDILWRHGRTGNVVIWQMDGSTRSAAASVGVISDRQWRVAGTGDFNGDRKSDILWRHSKTGGNVIWHMNGLSLLSAKPIPSVGSTQWTIAGIGDFDNDGKSDILWRQLFTGGNAIWLMNGFSVASAKAIPGVVDTKWQIAGVGDYDGNGKSGILWRHMTTGGNLIWDMDGLNRLASGPIGTVGNLNWRLVGNGHPPWVSAYTVSGNTQTEAAIIIEAGVETVVPFGPKDSNGDIAGLSGFHLNIDGSDMTVWLSTQGLPSVITTGGMTLHFQNYTQNTVDITVFETNGTATNYPGTSIDPALLARALSASTSSSSATISLQSTSLAASSFSLFSNHASVFDQTMAGLELVMCGVSIGTLPVTAGLSWALAAATCTSSIVSSLNAFVAKTPDQEIDILPSYMDAISPIVCSRALTGQISACIDTVLIGAPKLTNNLLNGIQGYIDQSTQNIEATVTAFSQLFPDSCDVFNPDTTLTTLNNQAPTVQITAPTAGSQLSGNVVITASARDECPTDVSVIFELYDTDGNQLKRFTDTAAPYEFMIDTAFYPDGIYGVTAKARDNFGVQGSTSELFEIFNTSNVTRCGKVEDLLKSPEFVRWTSVGGEVASDGGFVINKSREQFDELGNNFDQLYQYNANLPYNYVSIEGFISAAENMRIQLQTWHGPGTYQLESKDVQFLQSDSSGNHARIWMPLPPTEIFFSGRQLDTTRYNLYVGNPTIAGTLEVDMAVEKRPLEVVYIDGGERQEADVLWCGTFRFFASDHEQAWVVPGFTDPVARFIEGQFLIKEVCTVRDDLLPGRADCP